MCGASALCSVASVVVAAGGATCGHRTLHHSVVSAHSWPQGGKGTPLLMKWPLRVIIITRHTHGRHLLLASVLTNLGPSKVDEAPDCRQFPSDVDDLAVLGM